MGDHFPMDNIPNYQAIPDTPVWTHSSPQSTRFVSSPEHRLPLFRRRLFLSLGAIAILAAVAFTSTYIGRYSYHRSVESYPVGRFQDTYENTRFLEPNGHQYGVTGYPHIHTYPGAPGTPVRSNVLGGNRVIRENNWVVEKAVGTGDCGRGLYCRARIIVRKEGNEVNVEVGYYIYPVYSKPRNIDSSTRKRVKATTLTEAKKWASKLLSLASEELAAAGSHLSVDQVARAIMHSKNQAATCPRTDNPLCSTLDTVEVVQIVPSPTPLPKCPALIETAEEQSCREFFQSPPLPAPETFEQLTDAASSCEDKNFYYNRVNVSAPLCTVSCPQSNCPNSLRTVFAPFLVQAGTSKDCIARVFNALYTTYYNTLPTCDSVHLETMGENLNLISLYSHHDVNHDIPIPTQIADDYAACIGDQFPNPVIFYVYFMFRDTVADLISKACSAA